MGNEWTDEDSDAWAEARVREIVKMSGAECGDMLRRLAYWMAFDADRREVWADEHWAATTHD